jgi:hypothetical protein
MVSNAANQSLSDSLTANGRSQTGDAPERVVISTPLTKYQTESRQVFQTMPETIFEKKI